MGRSNLENDRPGRPPIPEVPAHGEEILREVERLKKEPIRIRCLGMSLGMFLLVLALAWLLWRIIR